MEEEIFESCDMLILPDSKRYRKDSIYYEEEPMPLTQENKEEEPIITFKKPRNKEGTRIHDEKLDLESKLKSSTSFSRREDIGSKDKTLRKMGSAKMIALGKYELQQIDKNDKSESYKQISMRNIKDKDKSLSKSKNYLKNSMTLRQNKSNSPTKDRRSKHRQFRDLKESGDLRKDFTKKRSP